MEFQEISVSVKKSKHFPLTPFRIIRGVICLLVLLSTAFVFLIYFVPVAAVLLRFFGTLYSRKVVSLLFGLWLGLWPFLFEKINETNVIFSGDHVPPKERVLLIANHRTEVDWMYLWNLALRKGCLGHIKYLLKKSLMKLPVFGWGFYVLEFIPLERKWVVDEQVIRQMLSTFTNPQDPLWLTVFPEGTDYTEQKCKRSQEFATNKGLPVLKNVLLPKTKGFYACLEILRSSLDAVYDVTIAYKNQCPTFLDNAFGVDPSEVHIHVRRIPFDKIPASEKEASEWLVETFQFKDKLLSDFIANGHFPSEGTEKELSTAKCLVNLIIVMTLTGIFMFFTYSFIWGKFYVGFSCIYLASAAYFNFRPYPIFGSVNERLKRILRMKSQ
ncbi:PREDICTED: probable 1-acyl-sn-glycerol-3-phosphate acyltransferase 4 [Nicotiana attenuata]|uniref:1-acylglycerol-3-phosphate O-acyltransferase n=1 Tax=Nicotiana attenuata TaxID=49451 RepID=A0A314KQW2_NICAT|nr:PREDICTED: probable 1-acyl-sn-glycerol-3-phosphate acyltransferase 4 [Nicotiana attenuata]XP_019227220.1 PREDICTED: probable 1-acyl-sn-glycerol-3-phosphate acyltransferase 4 [Nicotiana attenuata]OIT31547.1 putative 1-acyl-sn-glycerol-3-phosphate acyltransferase 4 [Nicotiana attenuata]